MLDSDDSDFYVGEQEIEDPEEQSTEIIKIETFQNCALNQSKLNCKLVKIENRSGHPKFHFEIDEKMYIYGIQGIKKDYKIILVCSKQVNGSPCRNRSSILPSHFLKQIIHYSPNSKYSKNFDKSDPRVFDLKNYDLNSFDIGEGHKCSGTEIEINEVKCKIIKIENRRGNPNFHFEIDGKMYNYGIRGIKQNYKIVLRCTKSFLGKTCNNSSFIAPLDLLKQIMHDNKSSNKKYSKVLDMSDYRVYDSKNYDLNSFNIGNGHKCPGIAIDDYLKLVNNSNNKPEIEINEVKCKIVKIEKNCRGHLNFHFEIDGKMYIYGIQGIRKDYKIVLRCTKSFSGKACYNSYIAPLDLIKQIMQDKASNKYYSKKLDTSDPRVYDIKNYDINSFDIGKGHKCGGTEISVYLQMGNRES
jgi:hypothetical protein